MDSSPNRSEIPIETKSPWVGIGILLGFSAIVLGSALFVAWDRLPSYLTGSHSSIVTKGAYGDTYGSVTALFAGVSTLFTGLAFLGLVAAIYLQTKELQYQRAELSLQRRELQDTSEELRGQKEQLQAQNETFQLQRFENTFFQLLRVHIDIVSGLRHREPGSDPLVGDGYLAFQRTQLRSIFRAEFEKKAAEVGASDSVSEPAHIEIINEAFREINRVRPPVDHYLRQLCHMIRFVDESDLRDKQRYATFVHAQMGPHALILLAYYGISGNGDEFRSLIQKYGFLDELRLDYLFHNRHAEFYPGHSWNST